MSVNALHEALAAQQSSEAASLALEVNAELVRVLQQIDTLLSAA